MTSRNLLGLAVALWLVPAVIHAQVPEARPLAVDISGGYAGFVDDAPIHHGVFGAAVRWRLSPRVSVGPEAVFMKGPSGDSDVFLTGKVQVDFMPHRVASPYVVADGGLMLHRASFLRHASFWAQEGAVSGGAGVRINVTPRVSFAPEFRIGWEPHLRIGGVLTWTR